jgi:hypothetical protein
MSRELNQYAIQQARNVNCDYNAGYTKTAITSIKAVMCLFGDDPHFRKEFVENLDKDVVTAYCSETGRILS